MIKINDKYFDIFIEKGAIESKINALANTINKDYEGKEVLFIAILNGSFMFASDLIKKIKLDCEISFIKVNSYEGTQSSGSINELIGLNTSIKDKHIIIIEDIVDTGRTMDKIILTLQNERPSSIECCSLLFKPNAYLGIFNPKYIGFSIENKFVVGYGLDYDQKGRNLEEIYQITESQNTLNENN